ncbi:unnamed protein product [Linum tenue]|uniref:Uncharacterized protein n=1 Tax=Linum tenue TaxID=586396 RepID=A0AAV0NXC2_9ROSI|nr:unnamed protein product [Linum tenue]
MLYGERKHTASSVYRESFDYIAFQVTWLPSSRCSVDIPSLQVQASFILRGTTSN